MKVENSKNDINLDVMELGVNDAPKAKDIFLKSSDFYLNYTMRTQFRLSTINASLIGSGSQAGWYDDIVDPTQELSFKIYLDTGDYKFLIFPSTYRMEEANFTIPHISSTYYQSPIDLYVVCTDKYAA